MRYWLVAEQVKNGQPMILPQRVASKTGELKMLESEWIPTKVCENRILDKDVECKLPPRMMITGCFLAAPPHRNHRAHIFAERPRTRPAILKHCTPKGIPTIVMQTIRPAKNHTSIPINPPKTNQTNCRLNALSNPLSIKWRCQQYEL